ncbi:MAG: YcxB family protein, partial [Clostridia bacterium]|nr:YcxB family protein [Clostridia bacterium]
MITERGTVKASTPITEQAQRELNKTTRTLGILYTALGAVALVLFVVLCIAESFLDDLFLLLGLIFFVGGIIILVSISKTNKTALKFQKVDEVEFFLDYMLVREYTNGEHTSTTKIYYNWIVKVKETHTYLFLFNTRATAVAVNKNSLPYQELNAVRKLLGRTAIGATATIQPQPLNNGANAGYNSTSATPAPADPFSDLSNGQTDSVCQPEK